MVFAAQAETLLHLYRKSLPQVYRQVDLMKQLITTPGGIEKLDGQFTRLPSFGSLKLSWNQTPNTSVLFVLKVSIGAIGKSIPCHERSLKNGNRIAVIERIIECLMRSMSLKN